MSDTELCAELKDLKDQVAKLQAEARALRITVLFAIKIGNIDVDKLAGHLESIHEVLLKGLSVETGEVDRLRNEIKDIKTQFARD